MSICFAQSFKLQKVKGEVKVQKGTSEKWEQVKSGEIIPADAVITTGKNSYVKINGNHTRLFLQSFSALRLSSLKRMSLNDLILALAMDDMINAPKKKEKINSKNTAVYGAEINGIKSPMIDSNDLGIKKLNGAVQLSENGYKESAIVVAEETFRKYPETKNMPRYRIYFANILYDLHLNEDAYEDFKSIEKLKLTDNEKQEVDSKIVLLAKKLIQD